MSGHTESTEGTAELGSEDWALEILWAGRHAACESLWGYLQVNYRLAYPPNQRAHIDVTLAPGSPREEERTLAMTIAP